MVEEVLVGREDVEAARPHAQRHRHLLTEEEEGQVRVVRNLAHEIACDGGPWETRETSGAATWQIVAKERVGGVRRPKALMGSEWDAWDTPAENEKPAAQRGSPWHFTHLPPNLCQRRKRREMLLPDRSQRRTHM